MLLFQEKFRMPSLFGLYLKQNELKALEYNFIRPKYLKSSMKKLIFIFFKLCLEVKKNSYCSSFIREKTRLNRLDIVLMIDLTLLKG